jgi:hypothetical protein
VKKKYEMKRRNEPRKSETARNTGKREVKIELEKPGRDLERREE